MNVSGIVAAVVSHAQKTGLFESVNSHEPKSAPTAGMTVAIWAQRTIPLGSASGLNKTTGLVELRVRLFASMLQQPYDDIDPAMMSAMDVLVTDYSGNFTLGGLVRNVDLLGAHGTPLSMQAGYITQDGKSFRVMDISLPLVINDLWAQVQ
jgi:hypothetical protein